MCYESLRNVAMHVKAKCTLLLSSVVTRASRAPIFWNGLQEMWLGLLISLLFILEARRAPKKNS